MFQKSGNLRYLYLVALALLVYVLGAFVTSPAVQVYAVKLQSANLSDGSISLILNLFTLIIIIISTTLMAWIYMLIYNRIYSKDKLTFMLSVEASMIAQLPTFIIELAMNNMNHGIVYPLIGSIVCVITYVAFIAYIKKLTFKQDVILTVLFLLVGILLQILI
ncbi:hypothetical protein [Companilactobacillus mishanensis]|uniref:Yip1 domain-containing protein n=1 Tax=Companilactobacillus mishanensis TaxID=2486008 RepID=A0A5P0ZJI0_9LACO|nr:hypothetical protein [Companilactobacillus mishanensis]MQS45863.1 hypothetical protein [Companilactobacillus mishanensis]MQS52817.1 hypothetical protein [Companilactobacillus mishanensis]